MTSSLLQDNQVFLRAQDPLLSDELAQYSGDEVCLVATGTNDLTAHHDGYFFHHREDPRGEAAAVVGSEQARVQLHFGFGLGYFAEAAPLPAKGVLLVFEPNPALIRAAMGVRDLRPLFGDRRIHICCSLPRYRLLVARFSVPKQRASLFASRYHQAVYPTGWQFFAKLVESLSPVRTLEYISRMYPLILEETVRSWRYTARLPDAGLWRDVLVDKPAVIVAAGPSLDKQLPELVRIRDRVVLFAISRSVGPLERMGISPDFMVHVEPQDYFHLISQRRNLAGTRFLLADQTQAAYFSFPHGATHVFQSHVNTFSNYLAQKHRGQNKLKVRSGGSVATAAFFMALLAGCNPLILVGQDLALRNRRIYADDEHNLPFSYQPQDLSQVPGFYGGRVQTLPHYGENLRWYEDAARLLAEEAPCRILINATGGGAHIQGFRNQGLAETARQWLGGTVRLAEPPAAEPGLSRNQVRSLYRELGQSVAVLLTLIERQEVETRAFEQRLSQGWMPHPAQDLPMKAVEAFLTWFKSNRALVHIFGSEVVGMRGLGEALGQCRTPDHVVDAWARLMVIHEDCRLTCDLLLRALS